MTARGGRIPHLRELVPMVMSYAASGGSLIVSSAAQLATFAILARSLGVHEFSLFVAVTAVSFISVHLCGLGGTECLVRRVARDHDMYPDMLGHNLILTGITGFLLVLAGSLILPFFLTVNVGQDPISPLQIVVLLVTNIVLLRCILLTEQIFIAFSNFASANLIVMGFAITRTAAAVLACLIFGVTTLSGWIIWQFAAHAVMLAFCVWTIRNLGKPRFRLVREELRLGLFFSIPYILKAARQNADLLILSLVTTAEIVASYSVARRIIESSYLSVDALNRISYPGTARASEAGLHNSVRRVSRIFTAAVAISVGTAIAVYILAPVLPYLFGAEYTSLVSFVRILCWVVVPVAFGAIAIEALGAAGHQGPRAVVLSTGSLLGAALASWATWYAPPFGTFVSYYVIEVLIAVAAWAVYFQNVEKDRARPRAVAAPAE